MSVGRGTLVSFGPYVAVSAARFSRTSTEVKCTDFRCSDVSLASGDREISNSAWHAWLTLGVRGTYLPL